ncbi:MAG: hypothetical protein DMG42_19145 [Acidobacteria bacterium]|nr:MAG: hypothetical protein DMG42_19145 [Acidobacteriota bacterium]
MAISRLVRIPSFARDDHAPGPHRPTGAPDFRFPVALFYVLPVLAASFFSRHRLLFSMKSNRRLERIIQ